MTVQQSTQVYWFLRQLRNRLKTNPGSCPICLRYIDGIVRRIPIALGILWAEERVVEGMAQDKKKKEAA